MGKNPARADVAARMTLCRSHDHRPLHDAHDDLAALVPTLSDERLSGPSGATEWTSGAGALALLSGG